MAMKIFPFSSAKTMVSPTEMLRTFLTSCGIVTWYLLDTLLAPRILLIGVRLASKASKEILIRFGKDSKSSKASKTRR